MAAHATHGGTRSRYWLEVLATALAAAFAAARERCRALYPAIRGAS